MRVGSLRGKRHGLANNCAGALHISDLTALSTTDRSSQLSVVAFCQGYLSSCGHWHRPHPVARRSRDEITRKDIVALPNRPRSLRDTMEFNGGDLARQAAIAGSIARGFHTRVRASPLPSGSSTPLEQSLVVLGMRNRLPQEFYARGLCQCDIAGYDLVSSLRCSPAQ